MKKNRHLCIADGEEFVLWAWSISEAQEKAMIYNGSAVRQIEEGI